MAVLRRWLSSLLVCAALLAAPAVLQAQVAGEYEVKAAFLYNFTKFVEWPPTAFADEKSPIQICVFGGNPFGKSLTELTGQEVAGRKLIVVRTPEMAKLEGCQILFISRSERERVSSILSEVREAPVLTVADTKGFLDDGGIVNFILEGSKVRFEISQEAADRAKIKISSKLMRLAKYVKGRPGPA
jgi:hypothetical protein